MEALEVGKAEEQAGPADVEALLDRLRGMAWEPAAAVGEGEEYRTDADNAHASALLVDGAMVHGSVVVAG
jgi:hypothetical protein